MYMTGTRPEVTQIPLLQGMLFTQVEEEGG